MTTDVLKVSGDYLLYAPNGNITLNVTSPTNTGTVRVIGNLDVLGQTTQIESTSSLINDNIIVLNAGETNPYVTLGTSGIAIDRGSNTTLTNAATMLYNDTVYWTNWANNTYTQYQGVFEFKSAGTGTVLTAAAVRTNNLNGNLNFLGQENPYGLLNVKGTVNYDQRVSDDDDIPNKKYVDNRIWSGTNYARKLQVGSSFIEINDNTVAPTDQFFGNPDTIFAALGSTSNVVFRLINSEAIFTGLTLNNNIISANTASDITLLPGMGHNVGIESPLALYAQTTTATAVASENIIYYSTATGGGGTGLYFVNTTRTDELVSRRKAIVYSIIF
jgi:hypothetical protein